MRERPQGLTSHLLRAFRATRDVHIQIARNLLDDLESFVNQAAACIAVGARASPGLHGHSSQTDFRPEHDSATDSTNSL